MLTLKTYDLLVITLLNLVFLVVASPTKYENINNWNGSNAYYLGQGYISITCGEIDNSNKLFSDSYYLNGHSKTYYGTINFINCKFREIEEKIFKVFENLHTFNISGVGLETLQIQTLRNAKSLRVLIASNNQLTEIAPHLFINAVQIVHVDFSNNKIQRIDPLAFEGAYTLQTLNLSNNQINQLGPHCRYLTSLLSLDLSNNNLTINEHVFDGITNLKHLNLSHNPIGNLKIGSFAFLSNLEELNLSRTNISNIQLGTFSHQYKLTSVDLSGNDLKSLDFNLFLSILNHLKSLYLSQNQLSELKSFRNAIVPQLILLDIKNNKFNCSYLQRFMENVNWEKLHLPVDPISTNIHEVNIRGINCDVIDTYETRPFNIVSNQNHTVENGLEKITSTKSNNESNDYAFIKCSLIFVCIMLSIYMLMIIKRDFILCQNIRPVTDQARSSSTQIIDFFK